MTIPGWAGRAVDDPVGLIVDLVVAAEDRLSRDQIAVVAGTVAGRSPGAWPRP